MRRFVARAPRLAVILLACLCATVQLHAQANVVGRWNTLPASMPINPVHVALVRNGKVVIVSGSGNVAGNTNFRAGLFDPATGLVSTQPLTWDMFCNGMSVMADGRVLIAGGTIQYDPFHGEKKTAIYDPLTNVFTNAQPMAVGRWYPTTTVMGDGRVFAFSGLDVNGATTPAMEYYTPDTGWSSPVNASWTPPLYPRMHLLPNGKIFYSGPGTNSALLDPASQSWTLNFARTRYGGSRGYGTSVLLPMTPANNYAPRVMILGGANPSTSSTEIIDLSQPSPAWQFAASMSQPRIEMSAVILPTGKVLALGGSLNDEDGNTASLNADLYDPVSNTMTSAGANAFPRLYHSVALLLPDASVWVAGGNPTRGFYQNQMEIYQPAYLFTTDGQGNVIPAIRPVLSQAPPTVAYGSAFSVSTPDAANISSIALIRPGSPTHAFDMDQRMVGLGFTDAGNNTLLVNAPAHGNLAPPGYYMLFLVNNTGVPSIASWVQVLSSDFSVTAAPPSQSVNQGGSTSFTATITPQSSFNGTVNLGASGLPSGVTATFTPSSLTGGDSTLSLSVSNSVAAGSYPFTITASSGTLTHSVNATLQVQANDFSLGVLPASRQVPQRGNTSFTATVTPQNGFSDVVALDTIGLPAGVTATFSPQSLSSGDSTLDLSIADSVAPAVYPFTVRGVSGSLLHTVNLTLEVTAAGNFTLGATPASRKVPQGAKTTWTATVTPQNGFSDPVTLGVTGLPADVTATFSSPTLNSGNSTLSVLVGLSVPPGSYPFEITGTSGTLSHSVNATLTVILQGTFTVTITPATQSVTRSSTSTYAVTITPLKGFHWPVELVVKGTGAHISASLDGTTVGPNGAATLTVNVDDKAARGPHTLRVVGTSGQLTKTGKLVLTIE